MEVIVVKRKYDQWEDSYTKILGVCITDEKADELIETDIHKDDHPLMSKDGWFNTYFYCVNKRKDLAHHESCGKKKGGFLNKFHYDQLNKTRRHAYDILKEKYSDCTLTDDVMYKFSKEDHFYLMQLIGN